MNLLEGLHPQIAANIHRLLQDANTEAAAMAASNDEEVRERGRELQALIMSAADFAADTRQAHGAQPGFWDQVAADADAVIGHMTQVKQAAASSLASGWYREDVNDVLRRVQDGARGLVRIRTNAERADRVGANAPNLAHYPNWPVQKD